MLRGYSMLRAACWLLHGAWRMAHVASSSLRHVACRMPDHCAIWLLQYIKSWERFIAIFARILPAITRVGLILFMLIYPLTMVGRRRRQTARFIRAP